MPKAGIVGGGVIGGGWAARFLLNGWDVAVADPDPEGARKLAEVLENARRSLPAIYDRPLPAEGRLLWAEGIGEAVAGADWVQESVPERLDLKHRVLAEIDAAAPAGAVIGSSTSGFTPSELTAAGARCIVAHPFNPVYLLPLVELVGEARACARAGEILRGIGMAPLTLRREMPAHVADRLLEAVWRESLWLVKDGVATTAEIDDAIRLGFGLRWAQMGLFETYRIAGGEAGMRHFLAQFGPALAWPWTRLTDVPDLDADLVERIATQSDAQSGHMEIRALERLRDDNLVSMLRALRRTGSGAGGTLRAHEARLVPAAGGRPPVTQDRRLPPGWTDAAGRLAEPHCLEIAAAATRAILDRAGGTGAGAGFVAEDTRIRHAGPVGADGRVRATTQVLEATGDRLALRHRLATAEGAAIATVKTRLRHLDPATGAPCPPCAALMAALAAEPRGGS